MEEIVIKLVYAKNSATVYLLRRRHDGASKGLFNLQTFENDAEADAWAMSLAEFLGTNVVE